MLRADPRHVTTDPPTERLQCWIDLGSSRNWQLYMSLAATTLFILPAVIIAACYIIIVLTIWRKGQELGSAAEKAKLPAGRYRAACAAIVAVRWFGALDLGSAVLEWIL